MKKIVLFIIAFMVSMPLTAQKIDPIFIGDFNSVVKDSILSGFNSDMYNVFNDFFKNPPLQNPCDDDLWNIGDTISGCDWGSILWSDSIAYVTLPEFPNCPLFVLYRVKICPNNPLIRQIDIVLYGITFPNYTDCDSLANYLNSGDEYQQATKYNEIDEKLHFVVSQHEAEQMDVIPLCDSLGNYLPQYVFYSETACKAKLIVQVYYHSFVYPPFIHDITCSREAGCCKRIVSFCKDSEGNPIRNVLISEPVGTSCVGYPVISDYEDILNYYYIKYPDAVNITHDPLPCMNVCD